MTPEDAVRAVVEVALASTDGKAKYASVRTKLVGDFLFSSQDEAIEVIHDAWGFGWVRKNGRFLEVTQSGARMLGEAPPVPMPLEHRRPV